MNDGTSEQSAVDRRSFLRAGAVSLIGASGCIERARNVAAHVTPEQVSLTIKTTPADDDPYAIRIAQRLGENLDAVGIDVEILPMRTDQLLQDVLVDQAFDLYVAAYAGGTDPDFLYPFVHSKYTTAPGWQNTFGYADLETDDLLERQRRESGMARRRTVSKLQRVLANKVPFLVVAFFDAIRAVRKGEYDGWRPADRHSTVQYVGLERDVRDPDSPQSANTTTRTDGDSAVLRVALTDGRSTENLNPIAVTFRNRGDVTDLLYDPLVLRRRGEYVPWLVGSWRWETRDSRTGPVLVLRLRDGLHWHDSRPVSADDVAFTYRFLADTSLGRETQPVPAPRFRDAESLVAGADVLDDRRVRLEFAPVHPAVARRALTVPILPEHVWRSRSRPAELAGIDLFDETTEALVWNNMDPVGSGPLQFRRAVEDETLILDRFEDHFLWDDDRSDDPVHVSGEPPFEQVVFRIVPSDGAATELLEAGELDATGDNIHAGSVPAAVKSDAIGVIVRPSHSFYHVGFNTRRGPLSNPRFRRVIGRLLDKTRTVENVFHGFAAPETSPLARSKWVASDLEWTGRDPILPFIGEDGRLDVERARSEFEAAGFRYDGSNRLRKG